MTGNGCTTPVENPDCPDGNMTGNGCIQQNNILPVANAGEDQFVESNTTIYLDAGKSYDADGNLTSYFWEQIQGDYITIFDSDTSRPSLISPITRIPLELKFQVTVTDDEDGTNSDSVTVLVNTSSIEPEPIENISITLDPVRCTLPYNQSYFFTGTVDGMENPSGLYVEIKDEDGDLKKEVPYHLTI